VTLVRHLFMTLEAARAADELVKEGIELEIIDVRTLNPFDETPGARIRTQD